MMMCPKCGSVEGWEGPRYQRRQPGAGERLLFACYGCGYMRAEPTKDAPVRGIAPPLRWWA